MTEREPRVRETRADGTRLPWRLRHPALSRTLLYGTGLVVVLVVLVLLQQRAVDNAADHEAYLESRLEQLDILNFSTASGRKAARQVLDEEFRGDALSPRLRARVLRIEAQLDARDGLPERGLELLAAARDLIRSPDELCALCLEEATLLQMAGQGEKALRMLEDPTLRLPRSETLRLHFALTLAWVMAEQGQGKRARELLEDRLAGWKGTPDEVSPAWVGTVHPTAVDSYVQATKYLCELAPCSPRPWLRLVRVFPDDLKALAPATLGLLEVGARDEAAALWSRARAIDPQLAASVEAQRPELKGLQEKREERLKPGEPPGR